jgi:hypothetical protein
LKNRHLMLRPFLVLILTSGPVAALELGLPVDCTLGEDCFIQQYVDRDPGPGVEDYACGAQTYDGHKGTDVRVRTTADVDRHVAVLAAAPGVVLRLRDGVRDHLARTKEDRAKAARQECGNGVLLDHGLGWQTQYCHLRQGSVVVKQGQQVAAGTKLGEVGYSGDATFPHVHLQVTKNGSVIDPFLPDSTTACGTGARSLWLSSAFALLAYWPGELLAMGLTDRKITLQELEAGAFLPAPNRHSAMLAYMWAINLIKGDVVDIVITHRGSVVLKNSTSLEGNKMQFMFFAGKKAPPGGWMDGTYTSNVQVVRNGTSVISGSHEVTLK